MKLVVTGTRSTTYRTEVMNAISEWYIQQDEEFVTLLHGDCEHPKLKPAPNTSKYMPKWLPRDEWSVDQLADEVGKRFNWTIKRFPADWYDSCTARCYHRKYDNGFCPAAGPRRNSEMIKLLDPKEDHVLAFPQGQSRGTRGCINLAEQAGINVTVFEL